MHVSIQNAAVICIFGDDFCSLVLVALRACYYYLNTLINQNIVKVSVRDHRMEVYSLGNYPCRRKKKILHFVQSPHERSAKRAATVTGSYTPFPHPSATP